MIVDGTRLSDRAIELVLAYYAAFNRGDAAAMLDLLTDDVAHDINQGARETGKAAFSEFLGRMERCYREQLRDIVVMANQAGDRAAAEYTVHGEYLATDDGLPAASGQKYTLPGGAFFDVRDGLIARVSNYYNLEDWVAQVSS
ncbi:ketosteroid isomerase-related protein [Arenimonas aestuarii]